MHKGQYKHKTTKRHKKRNVTERFWEKVKIGEPDDCWEWEASLRQHKNPLYRYGQFSFNGYPEYAHRVSWMLKHGNITRGDHICHICDNPKCVNPNHLFLGTATDNLSDMSKKERCGCVRLTADKVLEMKDLYYNDGLSFVEIGDKYRVYRTTAERAIKGKTWKHLK